MKPVQSYMNVGSEGTQIILVSDDAQPDCDDAMVATGTLERIDLGGKVGKNTYKGWALRGVVVSCR